MTKKEQFLKIFPENLKKYENLEVMAELFIDTIIQEAEPAMERLLIYLNMELQRDETLDKLACHWNVDFYETTMPREQKIKMIKDSFYFKSTKGTKGVLQKSLDIVYLGTKVKEWFEYGGNRYYFKIISDKIFDENEIKRIIDFVTVYKNVRSTLETIESNILYPTAILIGNNSGYSSNFESSNNRNCFNVASGSYLSSIMKVSQGG